MSIVRCILLVCLVGTIPAIAHAGSLGDRLTDILGINDDQEEILAPDDAFLLSADVRSPDQITVRWQIANGYYLYKDKYKFDIVTPGITLIDVSIPAGELKTDPVFGQVEVNRGEVEAELRYTRVNTAEQSVNLVVGYQGCKEGSICYPPITRNIPLLFDPLDSAALGPAAGTAISTKSPVMSRQDEITQGLRGSSLLINLVAFFGFGLLLAFTPCVFPMIPILSGIIVGQAGTITTHRAFLLSFFYVIAMALTYAILGVIAGSFHFNLQSASQNVWVITVFSAVFILLALSMFGFYELQLPVSWQNRLSSTGDRQQQGSFYGAAAMGMLSAIIVGPCVAPPLAGALLYISQTGNALLGGTALLAMGLGMGLPLLIIGTSAGRLLPRPGAWMDVVKRVFGVLMLAVAVWFLGRIIPGPATLALWSILLIVSAIYMGALDRLESGMGWKRIWKGLGLVFLVYGFILLAGAASGGKDVFNPLQQFAVISDYQKSPEFIKIKSIGDLDQILKTAADNNKALMLDFYADWCITCKEMDKYTLSDPEVKLALEDIFLVKADVTANDKIDTELLNRFNLFGPPAILFFYDGIELPAFRLVGFVNAKTFAEHIRRVKAL